MTTDRIALGTALRLLFEVLLEGATRDNLRSRIRSFLESETNRINAPAPEKTE